MRLLSWNMAHIEAHWREITSNDGLDVALLQEAVPPPMGVVLETIPSADDRWVTAGANRRFCAAIARLSDRVRLRPIRTKRLPDADLQSPAQVRVRPAQGSLGPRFEMPLIPLWV